MTHSHHPILSSNLFKRIITALFLGGGTLWMLITENPFTKHLMIVIAALVMLEWILLVFKSDKKNLERLTWLVFGGGYLMIGLLGFYKLYSLFPAVGLGLLFVIWSTDIGAYFSGKSFGGPKLAPSISPGKTWSGAIGGTISAFVTALVISHSIYDKISIPLISFFILCSILGQIGDLLESKMKRYFKVKDSSNFLPGHGGFIDRLDSLVFVGIFIYALYEMFTL